MRALLSALAAAAAGVLLCAGTAAAATPTATITTKAAFVAVSGTPYYSFCGGTAPLPVQPVCTTPPPVQARWGSPGTSGGQQSGLGFDPAGGAAPLTTTPFVLGTLTHFNWPIYNAADGATLALRVGAATASDGVVQFALNFPIGIVETPNDTPCPIGDPNPPTPCPDALQLPGGSATTSSASVGSHTYTLKVIGFSTTADGSAPQSQILTQEGQDNVLYLVATLTRNNTAPTAADDAGSTTSGTPTTLAVLANDGDVDHDALSAVDVSAPAHGTAVANADGTVTYTPSSSFAGVDTFTYRASDGIASSAPATVTVTVTDATPPVVSTAPDVVVEATGPAGATATYALPSATDNVDPAPSVTCAPASGSTFALGSNDVTCTATDASHNTSAPAVAFHVVVRDTTAPSLTVPGPIAVDATGPAGAVVTYAATATDAVDGSPAVTCTPPSGSTFAADATTTVSCTATDASGNTSAAKTFTVTVRGVLAQIDGLCVAGVGPGTSLCSKAATIKAYVQAGDTRDACSTLAAYANEVRAQRGKKLTAAQADALTARATRIGTLLGC